VASADSAEAEARHAEMARDAALVKGDLPVLEKLIGEGFTGRDIAGRYDTKASCPGAIRSGQLRHDVERRTVR